jgi:hypothetical protein
MLAGIAENPKNDFIITPLDRYPGGGRGPGYLEITGFRASPEWKILWDFDFLRVGQKEGRNEQANP